MLGLLNRNNKVQALFIFLIVTAVFCLFLFVRAPGQGGSSRSVLAFWNSGHMIGFAFLTIVLQSKWKKLGDYATLIQFFFLLFLSLVMGTLIELLQTLSVGRTASFMDIVRDVAGCFFVIAFFNPLIRTIPLFQKVIIQVLASSTVIILLSPLFIAVVDDMTASYQFPTLADFESPLELTRFEYTQTSKIDDQFVSHGKRAMKVILDNSQHSGIHLDAFPGNWVSFKYLKFSLFSRSEQTTEMNFRINDYKHNRKFEDRFNSVLSINPGWNAIVIALENVKKAPVGREMEMGGITHVRLFNNQLERQIEVYVDHFRLSKKLGNVFIQSEKIID